MHPFARITEQFTVPVLEALLGAFPFGVLGFHSDSEYSTAGSPRVALPRISHTGRLEAREGGFEG